MKIAVAIALALASAPLAAQPSLFLPGIADEETAISSGGVARYHRGHGDVLFVNDYAGRWYRVGLNEGCLRTTSRISSLAFVNSAASSRIDRFTTVYIDSVGGSLALNCRIDSIRRSEAPPQVDSRSRVTLD